MLNNIILTNTHLFLNVLMFYTPKRKYLTLFIYIFTI